MCVEGSREAGWREVEEGARELEGTTGGGGDGRAVWGRGEGGGGGG